MIRKFIPPMPATQSEHRPPNDVPPLPHRCGSWVVVERATGEAVMETFSRDMVERINLDRYEVLTALDYFVRLNRKIRETVTMKDEPKRQELAEQLWRREGGACVSYLVAAVAEASDMSRDAGTRRYNMLPELAEQAFELCAPIPDYEETALQSGWEPFTDKFGVACWRDTADGQTWAGTAEDLAREFDLELVESEVYEHWIVSDWLADKLEAKGEKVDKDFANLCVWARTCTGQSIVLDSVMQSIAVETIKA